MLKGAPKPLRKPFGKTQRLQKFLLAEGAGEEVRRASGKHRINTFDLAARHEHQQSRSIGIDRIGQHPHRCQPFIESPARIDDRNRRSRQYESPLGLVDPPRRNRFPSRTFDNDRQLVALPKRQQKQRIVRGKRSVGNGIAPLVDKAETD